MEPFVYRDGSLYCEGISLADIACDFGTPTYVYSQAALEENYRAIDSAFSDVPHLICYSLKANANLVMGRILANMGAGADVVSGGELFIALKMGMAPKRIVYASVGKTTQEIEYALRIGILMFNVESQEELEAINTIAGRLGTRAPVALRVNPDIDPMTHPYITTGMKKHKFGIAAEEIVGLYQQAQEMAHVEPVGIQMHIGSQLIQVRPVVEATTKLVGLLRLLEGMGIGLRYLDIGGGLGITYRDERPEGPKQLACAILPLVRETGTTLILEPGRFIVGNTAVLLTRVLYTKRNDQKKFVIVDAAMNDLIRPSLYGSYHAIVPVAARDGEETVDVVGPVCESGDFFAHDRPMPPVKSGDLLAIKSAGAYGYTMASNYNARPRAAEVLVLGTSYRLTRRRESYEDLVRGQEC